MEGLQDYFGPGPGSAETPEESSEYIDARCYVCAENVRLSVDRLEREERVNWRETMVCPGCGLNNRLRSSVHIFDSQVLPRDDDQVYLTEAVTPLYRALSSRLPNLAASEFSAEAEPGAMFETPLGPVRNEDITRLSFRDRSFHALLSFDVLEHVPDYRAALREFHRVLATGGQLILSAPFTFGQETRTRARLNDDGEVEHLLEPVYHGDPVSHDGVLCFHEFGMDLLQELTAAGFQDSFAICYHSTKWGYAGAQVMFIGRKRT